MRDRQTERKKERQREKRKQERKKEVIEIIIYNSKQIKYQ